MSLTYTTGNPSNLTAGATASMNDIQGPFTDIRTWANAGFSAADLTTATLQTLGMNNGGQVGRGKSIIASTEARSNVAYGTLTTPDQVAGIVLPTDGVICVLFHAFVQESVTNAGRVSLFLGANQLRATVGSNAVAVQETGVGGGTNAPNTDAIMTSFPHGLTSPANTSAATLVTTGQAIAISGTPGSSTDTSGGGPCFIFAAAGTYTVSVQFKASSGSITAKNRKLWVWTLGF